MTLSIDRITVAQGYPVNSLSQLSIENVSKPCYEEVTAECPEEGWLEGKVALVDPITGWEYCVVFFPEIENS